jgi:hypothetical protein
MSVMFHEGGPKIGANARGTPGVPFVRDAARAIACQPDAGGGVWAGRSRGNRASGGGPKYKGHMGFGSMRGSAGVWNRFRARVVFSGRLGGTAKNAGESFSTNAQVTDRQYYCGSRKVRETRQGG